MGGPREAIALCQGGGRPRGLGGGHGVKAALPSPGGAPGVSGLTLCLGHRREKLSSVSKQPARRKGRVRRGSPSSSRDAAPSSPPFPRRFGLRAAKFGTQTTNWGHQAPRHPPRGAPSPPRPQFQPAQRVLGGGPHVSPPRPRCWGAHLCRWHTRSGRCGDTPSGSSPPWPPLAGSSSTSEHAAGRERETERPRQSPKWPPLSPSCPPRQRPPSSAHAPRHRLRPPFFGWKMLKAESGQEGKGRGRAMARGQTPCPHGSVPAVSSLICPPQCPHAPGGLCPTLPEPPHGVTAQKHF